MLTTHDNPPPETFSYCKISYIKYYTCPPTLVSKCSFFVFSFINSMTESEMSKTKKDIVEKNGAGAGIPLPTSQYTREEEVNNFQHINI